VALYCLDNARSDEQRNRMIALEGAGVCRFCPQGLTTYGSSITPLFESASWLVVDNDFPYAGALRHLLLIPRPHVLELVELTQEGRTGYWEALEAARAVTGGDSYGLGVRNGDCAATGATIAHLHVHFLVPDPRPEAPALRMRFSGRSSRG
jgi:ATP adenylyltransferase